MEEGLCAHEEYFFITGKGGGGRKCGVELEIQESNTGQHELSCAIFGPHL